MRCEVAGPWQTTGNENRMRVALDYPATWTDVTGQRDGDVAAAGRFVACGEVSAAQLTALRANPAYAVLWSAADEAEPAPLDSTALNAVRTALAAVYAPDVAKLVTLDTAEPAAIAAALKAASLRPVWTVGVAVVAGDVVQYDGNLFECVQGHTVLETWPPTVAVALWKRYYEPADDPWPWVQPLGSHDAYPVGARVAYNGQTWVNTIAANVWQPGVTGWTREGGEPATSEWVSGEQGLKVGDVRTYQGVAYSAVQNPGVNIWPPPSAPALWQPV